LKEKMAKFSFHILRKLPAHEKKLTISTIITLGRLCLIPFIVAAMVMNAWKMAFILFCVAAISDVLDGFLARWLNEHTFLGACLDPIVDKLLVLVVFATLAFIHTPLFAIPYWFVLFVFIKELIIVIGSVIIYAIKGHVNIKPTRLGKTTAFVQMLFIVWLFACYFLSWLPIKTFNSLLVIILLFLLSSLLQYLRIGLRQWNIA
jgi:cardiolipin synthase (CMP-forming)